MCSHMSGGEALSEKEKQNFQECLEFCNMSYVFQKCFLKKSQVLRGRVGELKKQTQTQRVYFSIL